MNYVTQILRRGLGVLALIAAAVASSMAQSTFIVLESGAGLGSRDAANQFTLDKDGKTWQDAYVVQPMPNYHKILGTQYISATDTGRGFPHMAVRYRTTFQLPDGYSNPSFYIDIHADNAATIYLNGHLIGQQDQVEEERNFQNPAEQYKTGDPAHFNTGLNVVEFVIQNYNDPSGFDYRAIVSYTAQLQVGIDIKPGEYPNTINLGSNGVVPVAILSSPSFDATQVDPLTVTLAGASVALRGRGTPMVDTRDVNSDGLMDLVVHVETEALELSAEDTEAILLGRTFDGTNIKGIDSVRIVP